MPSLLGRGTSRGAGGRPRVPAFLARHDFQNISVPFRREHPDGLLVGDRFYLRDHPDEVLEEAARLSGLIAIQPGDPYQASVVPLSCPDETRFDGKEFDRLHQLTGKPMVIADHQWGFFDDQTPKTGSPNMPRARKPPIRMRGFSATRWRDPMWSATFAARISRVTRPHPPLQTGASSVRTALRIRISFDEWSASRREILREFAAGSVAPSPERISL